MERITIDVDRLKDDLREECQGAFFVGGFGGALMSSFDVDSASPERLVEMARENGLDLRKYEVRA